MSITPAPNSRTRRRPLAFRNDSTEIERAMTRRPGRAMDDTVIFFREGLDESAGDAGDSLGAGVGGGEEEGAVVGEDFFESVITWHAKHDT